MSRKARWAMAVLGVAVAGVVVGAVGAIVFRFGWTEPNTIEIAREAMQTFDHDSHHAHDEQDPFPHTYILADFFFNGLHRHCLTHDVNGDGDTDDPEDNDGTCPGSDTGLLDSTWHPPLPDPGGPAKESALKYGVFLGAGMAGWIAFLLAVFVFRSAWDYRRARAEKETEAGTSQEADQPATAHGQDPRNLTSALFKGPLWANALLGVMLVSILAFLPSLWVFDARWDDSKNTSLAHNYLWSLGHTGLPDHPDGSHRHFYLDGDGRVSAELHRHCLKNDVNGDGDTADPLDNDGTCPGPDTGVADLARHRLWPNPNSPAGVDGLKEAGVIAAGTAIALTAILAAVGIPWAARRNWKLKSQESAEAKGPPTTQTN